MGRPMRILTSAAVAALLIAPSAVQAEEISAVDLSGTFTVDTVATLGGDSDARARVLTNLDLIAELDLAQLAGWDGTHAHVHVIDNRGARPNDAAGTLQGVDNIEVAVPGTRLFEAWVEQDFGSAAVLTGLYDVNSEFYANESAGLLVAPAFGIGSEFAATGPSGPSIFPSSALAVRVRIPVATGRARIQLAALNAQARTLGDGGGIDVSFREGLLLVGEAGLVEGPVRASLGGWAYTKPRDDVFHGTADSRKPWGGYALMEASLTTNLTAFLRAGFSEGHTSPFSGGLQAGTLLTPVFADRKESAFSIGFNQAWINDCYRAFLRTDGASPSTVEQAYAATYADTLFDGIGVQGDVQWIRHPGGLADAQDALVTTLRLTFAF